MIESYWEIVGVCEPEGHMIVVPFLTRINENGTISKPVTKFANDLDLCM